VIYPEDSAIQRLNNWSLVIKLIQNGGNVFSHWFFTQWLPLVRNLQLRIHGR